MNHYEFIFEVVSKSIEYYELAFGYPYPFKKYDQVLSPLLTLGALES